MSTNQAEKYFIGLMSGTSMDGVDCVIVALAATKLELIGSHLEPIPEDLKSTALKISLGQGSESFTEIAELDAKFGHLFANSVNHLLQKTAVNAQEIIAIGSHGQTLWHQPSGRYPFTLQIGDPNIIAKNTAITTVADFRRADIALGGQGAPFVPPFHQWLFGSDNPRIVLNIGGIANITVLAQNASPCFGFDTGPGNGLMDAWIMENLLVPYDQGGAFAKQGQVQPDLLQQLLDDPFFTQTGPKSTGKDYFNLRWLKAYLKNKPLAPADIQATLLELTAISISKAIKQIHPTAEIVLCGGGCHNTALVACLEKHLGKGYHLNTTLNYGLHPDWVEAACFAWLAKMRLDNQAIDLTAITGARKPAILGGIFAP